MTLTATVDAVIAPQEKPLALPASLAFIALAFLSWTVGELSMAPAMKSMLPLLWVLYTGGTLALVGWYYRISRMLETPWMSWTDGFSAAAWAIAPAHLLLPAGVILHHGALYGMVAYELVKLALILVMLQRMMVGLKRLNAWPAWAAMLLAISPLLVTCIFLFFILMIAGVVILTGFAGRFS